ncbi:hypothetical protein AYI68_g417 [Smittium mucronatum]|uniref:Uncharacterized protein n=1 Tax=Smittium mucronatum TaxID=133383 RepID=A0A1R0H886_9FUNG|nr:hypothetical protein AYI68_g417 [Smittium mucronatum]
MYRLVSKGKQTGKAWVQLRPTGPIQVRTMASHHPVNKSMKILNALKSKTGSIGSKFRRVLVEFEESPQTLSSSSLSSTNGSMHPTNHAKSRLYVYSASAAVIGYFGYEAINGHHDSYTTMDAKKNIDVFDPHIPSNVEPRKNIFSPKTIDVCTPASVEHQVEWSLSHPGLYVWGSNEYGTLDPERVDKKTFVHPWEVNFFKGSLLRAVSFSERHAAAIDEKGDVYQWGENVAGGRIPHKPKLCLKGMHAQKLATSKNKTFVTCEGGEVYQLESKAPNISKKTLLKFKPELDSDET